MGLMPVQNWLKQLNIASINLRSIRAKHCPNIRQKHGHSAFFSWRAFMIVYVHAISMGLNMTLKTSRWSLRKWPKNLMFLWSRRERSYSSNDVASSRCGTMNMIAPPQPTKDMCSVASSGDISENCQRKQRQANNRISRSILELWKMYV